MATRHLKIVAAMAALLVIAVALATCRGAPEPEGPPVAPAASTGPGAGGNAGAGQTAEPGAAIELTPALLEAYAKGLRKEVEIIRRPGRGTHYGVTVSKYGEEGPEVVRAAGLSHEDYRAVQDVVDRVFTTLNFQGKIGPARSIDLEKADPVWRERLAGDPFDELSPASAKALRDHMDILVPPWSEIVEMTALND
ncbi:hypothetical protein [Luteimonas lutimaris]|uniref:Uncharacterized protein n=1 Tax=Luteimonas lutimaris TaxID=698645 RepID=A0ABP7MAF3_9GAMM